MIKPVDKIFPEKLKLKQQGFCPICHNKVDQNDFKDELSKKEFKISGMCQECQDEFWSKSDE